jgi:hypothetical protein
VRSAPRRGPAPTAVRRQLRQLDEQALAAYGYAPAETTKFPPPDLAFHFGLVGHGYEARLFVDGKYVATQTRDFSGNHKIDDLKQSLYTKLVTAIDAWRNSL